MNPSYNTVTLSHGHLLKMINNNQIICERTNGIKRLQKVEVHLCRIIIITVSHQSMLLDIATLGQL